MSEDQNSTLTTRSEVIRIGVCGDDWPEPIKLIIDDVTQEGIKSVDLLSFLSTSRRNAKQRNIRS